MENSSPETELSSSDTISLAPKKRGGANRKERKRTQTMNSAFSELRNRIPNVPPDTKLSKIKTLRLAISYIRYLMDVLAEDSKDGNLLSHKDFAIEIAEQSDRRDKRKKEVSVSCFVVSANLLPIPKVECSCPSSFSLTYVRYFTHSQQIWHRGNVDEQAGRNMFGP
mgnify:CR=1 FL=1